MSQLGEIILELRKDKGLTQKQLAEKLRTSTSSISSYETGARLPHLDTIVEYAKFFDVTTDYLLGRSIEDISLTVLTDDFVAGTSYGALIQSVKGLSMEQKGAIALMVDDMRFCNDIKGKLGQRGARGK